MIWILVQAHLKRRKTQNTITILGIAVGVMVLVTALSLTNGFTKALVDATLRAMPHLALSNENTRANPQLEKALTTNPEVVTFAPYIADKGLLTKPASAVNSTAQVNFATFFGVTPNEAEVLSLRPEEKKLLSGLKDNEIVLGLALARSIGAYEGDTLRILSSEQKRLTVKLKGTFKTGNYLIDSAFAFLPLNTVRSMNSSSPLGYHVRLKNPETAPKVGLNLMQQFPYYAQAWQDLNASLLEQMVLQKRIIGIVVFLIVLVAAFGIANVLVLSVFEKTQEIAILRAMGMPEQSVLKLFVLEGFILGVLGLVAGNILGLGLSWYFKLNPVHIPGDLYFISSLPVDIQAGDFVWVNAVSIITTVLASFIPARRAAKIEPAKIIR